MNLWIETQRPALLNLMGKLDGLVLNDSEARLLTGLSNTVEAGRAAAAMVKHFVVVKKGEHGSLLFADGRIYTLPAYPAFNVIDPTGAGDCFAGAMMGYLAAANCHDATSLLAGMAHGTVVASLELEGFSLQKLMMIRRADIDARLAEFISMTSFGK